MIANGALTAQYLRDAALRNPASVGEPPGTRSQVIRYVDPTGQWIVEVHRYLRPDGTLGAGGRPDPKRLRLAGVIYVAR
jgi:hypothetical protein